MSCSSTMVNTAAPEYLMNVDVRPEGSMTKGHRPSCARKPPTSFRRTSAIALMGTVRLKPREKLRVTGNGSSFSTPSSGDVSASSSAEGLPYVSKNFMLNSLALRWLNTPSFIKESPFTRSMSFQVKSSVTSRSLLSRGSVASSSSNVAHTIWTLKPRSFPAAFASFSFLACSKSFIFNLAREAFHSHSCTLPSKSFTCISADSMSGSSSASFSAAPCSTKDTFCWR
mmetsp:Transcript_8016/g.18669  ORF Transcript_8016/g.18669 Transcript_8016/m.18669 type:complete len:227 (-) Transcript_8016:882-1562(-)